MNKNFSLYISSCVDDGGIYYCSFNRKNGLSIKQKLALKKPMYTVFSQNKLVAIQRCPFSEQENQKHSGIVDIEINNDNSLGRVGQTLSTKGEVACHLCAVEGDIYAANYISGSIIKMPDKLCVHSGKSIHPTRQQEPHTHFVALTPDNKYIVATDLGTDKIHFYDKQLNPKNTYLSSPGNGPRHIAFSQCGKYAFCANELSSTVTMYLYNDGTLTMLDEKSTLDDDFDGQSTAAAIRCHDGRVFVSNRGEDTICSFDYQSGKLCDKRTFSVFGKSPRDFDIIDNCFVSTNEASNSVTVVDAASGELLQEISIDAPLCISYKAPTS